MAGSQVPRAEPGIKRGLVKCTPPSVDRANPMPPQPIHAAYTSRGAASALTTSAFCPRQPRLTSVTGVCLGALLIQPAAGCAGGAAPAGEPVKARTMLPAAAAPARTPAFRIFARRPVIPAPVASLCLLTG